MVKSDSLPLPGQRYQDKRGDYVTVESVEFNQVTFMRDGYYGQCIYPLDRFAKVFTAQKGGEHE